MAFYDLIDTPVGTLFIGGSRAGLHRLDFLHEMGMTPEGSGVHALEWSIERLSRDAAEAVERDPRAAEPVARQLHEYFARERTVFDVALAPRGTEFQRRVWEALTHIPPGETRSYGAIASMIGRPTATRAVGAANGQNPITVIVPCHRVVGANGTLTGYGGGLERKRWLLDHESARPQELPLFARAS